MSPLDAHAGTFHFLFFCSAALTAMTYGSRAGIDNSWAALPSFPTAVTTTIPAFHARSTANANGSMVYG